MRLRVRLPVLQLAALRLLAGVQAFFGMIGVAIGMLAAIQLTWPNVHTGLTGSRPTWALVLAGGMMGSFLVADAVLLWRRKRVGRILGAVLWSTSLGSAYFWSGSRDWGDMAFNVLMLGLLLAGWGAAEEALD